MDLEDLDYLDPLNIMNLRNVENKTKKKRKCRTLHHSWQKNFVSGNCRCRPVAILAQPGYFPIR